MAGQFIKKSLRYAISYILSRRLLLPVNTGLLYTALWGLGVNNRLYGDPSLNERKFLHKHRNLLGSSPVVIDVGANIGKYSAEVRKAMPDAKVYAFEPNPVTFEKLQALSAKLAITPINMACSDSVGTMTLYGFEETPDTASSSLSKDVITFTGHRPRAFDVQTTRLTTFLKEHEIEHVNLLKIDAEGHDLQVLSGVSDYIEKKKIDIIQYEFARLNCVSHTLMKDFYDLLGTQYSFYRLAANGDLLTLGEYEPVTWELFGHQNIVAVRHDLALPAM